MNFKTQATYSLVGLAMMFFLLSYQERKTKEQLMQDTVDNRQEAEAESEQSSRARNQNYTVVNVQDHTVYLLQSGMSKGYAQAAVHIESLCSSCQKGGQ